jgi:hypothetical protein
MPHWYKVERKEKPESAQTSFNCTSLPSGGIILAADIGRVLLAGQRELVVEPSNRARSDVRPLC